MCAAGESGDAYPEQLRIGLAAIAVEKLVTTRHRHVHAHPPLARHRFRTARPAHLAAAVVVVEHVDQRHKDTVLVLVLVLVLVHTRVCVTNLAAPARARCRYPAAVLGEAAGLVRQVSPHPRLAREDLGGEHRWLRDGQRREEHGVLAVQVLPPP